MIKLGKLTDYAIVVMGHLSREGSDAARSAHYLSEMTGLPEPTVAKVLKSLAQAGLVESLRGSAGGYRLSRPAAYITAADVITALEGPIAIVSCANGSGEDCKLEATCPAKNHWVPVNEAIQRALQAVYLTDLVPGSTPVVMNGMPTIRVERRQ